LQYLLLRVIIQTVTRQHANAPDPKTGFPYVPLNTKITGD